MKVNPPNIEKQLGLESRSTQVAFIAMQYWLTLFNRTYVVLVKDGMVCGGKIRGMSFSPKTRQENKPWFDLKFYMTEEILNRYKGVDPLSDQFRSIDRANFQFPSSKIVDAKFDPREKFGMGYVPHTGRLYLTPDRGRVKEFIILADQNGKQLARNFSAR